MSSSTPEPNMKQLSDAVETIKKGVDPSVFKGIQQYVDSKDGQQLLKQANIIVQDFNGYMAHGSNYSSVKTQDDLRLKYQTAQMNTLSNADQLQDAAMHYYTVAKNGQYANDFQSKQLGIAADKIVDAYAREFADIANQATVLNNAYQTDLKNSTYVNEYYNNLVKENEHLSREVGNLANNSSTNYRKSYYENQEIAGLKWWYWVFLVIYIILVISFAVAIFASPSQYSLKYKISILVALILYAFVAKYLMLWFINALFYVYRTVLPTNVYLGFSPHEIPKEQTNGPPVSLYTPASTSAPAPATVPATTTTTTSPPPST